jgi:ribonuclease D
LSSGGARPGALVSSGKALRRTVEEVRSGGLMALDTEFLRERTYRSKLCLVQIATSQGLCLIDPLARVDLTPVAHLIADPAVEVVVHAGRQDLELFYERFGALPANVFDVQIAAGFVGHGASLPYARVVEIVLGRRLVKGESYSDWCKRPLTDSQLRYAADDVAWLLEVADRLKRELSARERTQWAAEEMRILERRRTYEVDPSESWRRVGGRGGLPASKLAVLREVARWREETAMRRDLPRGWVVKDPTLIEIARRGPRDLAGLKAIRGMSAAEANRSGAELLAAVAAGTRSGPIEEPEVLPRWAQVRARMISGLADALVRARSERAEVAAELVATRGELESLIADVVTRSLDGDGGGHRLLTGWRRALAGEAVLDLARGRIGVRASDRPPYIEEVPL